MNSFKHAPALLLIMILIIGVNAAYGSTPGAFAGATKTGRYFSFSMDGAEEKDYPEYTERTPIYSSVGTLGPVKKGLRRVQNEHAIPNSCSLRIYKVEGIKPAFVCQGSQHHPMGDTVYQFQYKRMDAEIFRCIKRCTADTPESLSYEDLE